jgi:hypothetical protein
MTVRAAYGAGRFHPMTSLVRRHVQAEREQGFVA